MSCLVLDFLVLTLVYYSNKAVSDGAISFHLDHYVRTRVARVTYGCRIHKMYDSQNADHVKRASKLFTGVDGTEKVPDFFLSILPKVNLAFESMFITGFSQRYYRKHKFLKSKSLERI